MSAWWKAGIAVMAIALAVVAFNSITADNGTQPVKEQSRHGRQVMYMSPPAGEVAKPAVNPPPAVHLSSIDIDKPETYPPMPLGAYSRTEDEALGGRVHYTVAADLREVMQAGRSGLVLRTAQAPVLMFSDGTGLVLLGNCQVAAGIGRVLVDYSVPPGMPYRQPTAVLASIRALD